MVVNVAELKSRLSHYLRLVRRGERIVVMDRSEPVAELAPLAAEASTARERLAREGRLRLGRQDLARIQFSALARPVAIQDSLAAIRDDDR